MGWLDGDNRSPEVYGRQLWRRGWGGGGGRAPPAAERLHAGAPSRPSRLPSRGMGFCLFNNIAIVAAYAVKSWGWAR